MEILSWLDDHSRYPLGWTAHQPVTGDRGGRFLWPSRSTARRSAPSRITAGSTQPGSEAAATRSNTCWRSSVSARRTDPRAPSNTRQIEPFHQTLQRWLEPDRRPARSRAPAPARPVPRALQRAPPAPRLGRQHPGACLPRHPQGLPATRAPQRHYRLRYDRLDIQGKMSSAAPAECTTSGSGQRLQTRPRTHPRPPPHRHRTGHRRKPFNPPHRTRQDLLAQPTKRARPLAELLKTVTHVPRHVKPMSRDIRRPMSRDITGCREEGLEPPMDETAHTGFRDRRMGLETPIK